MQTTKNPFEMFRPGKYYQVKTWTPRRGHQFIPMKFVTQDAFGNHRAGFLVKVYPGGKARQWCFFDCNKITVLYHGSEVTI